MERESLERSGPDASRPTAARTPAAGGPAGFLLGLQGAAGNRAVSSMVQRRAEESTPAPDDGVATPGPIGSTAPEAEEQDGPVGGTGLPAVQALSFADITAKAGELTSSFISLFTGRGGQAGQGGQGAQPPPPTPTPPTITSATAKAAPSGAANTRTTVGVGEVVGFTSSVPGTWTATGGTSTGPSSGTFAWTAPPTAQSVTITVTTPQAQTASITMTVLAPASISMRRVSSHGGLGPGGACMLTEVTFNPTTVNLGATQWLEVPGPATATNPGFFTKFSAATLHHNPNPNYAIVNDNNVMEAGPNNGPNDHCAWHSIPGPYSDGSFTWDVPNRYKIDGEPDTNGRWFCDTHQIFTMSSAGTLTITKAGAST